MILGMNTFTFVHVVISLVGVFSGLMVAFGLIAGRGLSRMTALFLVTTVATSVTGFMFPYHGFTPGIGVGILSMVVLVAANRQPDWCSDGLHRPYRAWAEWAQY